MSIEHKPLLSICIPTYNRAAYLPTLLDGIFTQKNPNVEVVVSDNASADNTSEIIKKYPGVIYHRSGKNLGFDVNVLKAVSLASGKYCWLVGDDDALKPGALEYLLQNIKSNYGFYAVSVDLCDVDLKFLQCGDYIKQAQDGEVIDLSRKKTMLAYLARVKANMGLFGYMGTAVFQKTLWDKNLDGADKVVGLGWVHVYMLWRMKGAFQYLARPVLDLRLHNDAIIKNKGRVARLVTEFKGLYLTARVVFADDKAGFEAFVAAVARYVAPNSIPPLFMLTRDDKKHWPQLVEWINKYPYPQKFKKSLDSRRRLSVIYFLREFLNKPACRHIKKPFKFVKDYFKG